MDTSSLPFMQDYGISNGPVLIPAAQQSNDDFVKSITTFDLNYNAQNLTTVYTAPKSVWSSIADSTSEAVSGSSEFVWNTATGAWESTKAGVASVYNTTKEALKDAADIPKSFLDGLLTRGFLIFAAVVLGFVFLAKSGALKDIAQIIGSVTK